MGDVAEGPGVDEHRRVLDASGAGWASSPRGCMTVMAPAALSCSAVTGSPSSCSRRRSGPDVARRSRSDVARARIAMTSEAAVMSNPVSRGMPSSRAPEAAHDVAERSVVDVEHASPGDAVRVDAQRVAVVDVVVDHGGQEVVGRRHGVQVAGEVQVEGLERDHLAVAATGRPALDARTSGPSTPGGWRWSPACRCGPCAWPRPTVVVVLPSPRGVGVMAVTTTYFAPRTVGQLRDRVEVDLHHVTAVRFEQVTAQPHLVRDVLDRFEGGAAGDV